MRAAEVWTNHSERNFANLMGFARPFPKAIPRSPRCLPATYRRPLASGLQDLSIFFIPIRVLSSDGRSGPQKTVAIFGEARVERGGTAHDRKNKTYFETLEGLSTEELDRSAEKLVRAEKRNLALVIAHIAEMSRRKGQLERGYKNLFEYCTRRLHLSEGSVALRIQVANVSRRFPQILVALAENRMSLTVAGLLAPVLTESNVEKLLFDCTGMTKREVEEYLVAFRPKPVFAPSIRKAPSPPALISPPAALPTPPQPAPQATMPRPVPRASPSILEP